MRKVKFNSSFAFKRPSLLKEWDYKKNRLIDPKRVACFSHRKVWWKCQKGHKWEAVIASRSCGRKCPYCTSRIITKNNNLAFLFPHLAKEWDYKKNGSTRPETFFKGSHDNVWWKCPKGHSYQTEIYSRTGGHGCPYCAGKKVNSENCLASKAPHLIKEWDFKKNTTYKPTEVGWKSNKVVWWKCRYGHSWKTSIFHRTRNLSNCPRCRGGSSDFEIRLFSELKVLFPRLVHRKRINRLEMDIFIPSLRLALEFDGAWYHAKRKRHELKKERLLKQMGIKLIRLREKGLTLKKGDIPVDPKNPKKAINSLLRLLMRRFELKGQRRRIAGYLKGDSFHNERFYKKSLVSLPDPVFHRSLAARFPKIAKTWHPTKNLPLTPKSVSSGSGRAFWWKCKRSHTWLSKVTDRVRRKCPYCSRKRVSSLNRLSTKRPSLLKEWDFKRNKLKPSEVSCGSNKKAWWICKAGHRWKAVIYSRYVGHGCPICNT